METLEFNHKVFDAPADSQLNNEGLFVRFFKGLKPNDAASEAAQRPIFEECDYIEIRTPGDRNNIVCRPVRDMDRTRFPKQWQAWHVSGNNDAIMGTPLTEWPPVSRAMAEELKYFGFTTVEQVAAARDDVVARVPGLTSLKTRAAEFCSGTNEAEKLKAALAERDAQTATLLEQMAALQSQVAQLAQLDGVPTADQNAPEGDALPCGAVVTPKELTEKARDAVLAPKAVVKRVAVRK